MVRRLFVGADIFGAVDLVVRVLVTVLTPPLDHAAPLNAPPYRPDDTTPSPTRRRAVRHPSRQAARHAAIARRSQVPTGRERVELRRLDYLRQRYRLVGHVRAFGHAGAEHDRRHAARPE